jgi:peptidylprolyl isomerase
MMQHTRILRVMAWSVVGLMGLTAAQSTATAQAGASKVAPKPAASKPAASKPAAAPAQAAVAAGPVVTMETAKGTVVFTLFKQDAPKSVDHIVALIKNSFYRSQRITRVVPGQLVQFGDKQSRDMSKQEWWGRGADSGSGNAIGVAEISKTRTFKVGSVGLAHSGDPAGADNQMFFALKAIPAWNGKYTIIGQVTSGLDVLPKLQVTDLIKLVTVKE